MGQGSCSQIISDGRVQIDWNTHYYRLCLQRFLEDRYRVSDLSIKLAQFDASRDCYNEAFKLM